MWAHSAQNTNASLVNVQFCPVCTSSLPRMFWREIIVSAVMNARENEMVNIDSLCRRSCHNVLNIFIRPSL